MGWQVALHLWSTVKSDSKVGFLLLLLTIIPGPSYGTDGATHIQDGSFLLSEFSPETPSQTCLNMCVPGDSKSSQVNTKD